MTALLHIFHFFVSLRTAIWLILALLFILFYGSFVMPVREEFQALHTAPLFQWMTAHEAGITWWLWAAIGILSLLTANTIVCSIESVIRKRGLKHWLLVISPQLIHVGFLFMLLAHLLSSYGSFKGFAMVQQGSTLRLPSGTTVMFESIRATVDPNGYVTSWSADVNYYREDLFLARDVIKPNSPSFRDGLGLYIKTVKFSPYPVAMIEASREPGALWALIGSVFFLAGMITLLLFKIRLEERRAQP